MDVDNPRGARCKMAHSVIMYTTPTCGYCNQAKHFLDKNHIQYKVKDLVLDPGAREEFRSKTDATMVPTFDIDGQIIVGYDEDELYDILVKK